ncbi:MAG: hypothetical protein DSY84_02570 [Candidatus Neomarinimicrobiota bacterium]|nr:MAG: hypothetical protein DSY84_02570 [Candidatus Neomarinimicrobiota bacterium]
MGLAGGPRRIPQALEWNGHFRGPPIVDESAAHVEQRIPGPVAANAKTARAGATTAATAAGTGATPAARATARPPHAAAAPARAAASVHDRIARHAVAVHREHVGALLVEERVEQHRHLVVAAPRVALCPVRADDPRVGVVGVERDIDLVAVVREPDFGRLGGGSALDRARLDERRDRRHIPPHWIIQPAIDYGRLRRPDRDRHRAAGDREASTAAPTRNSRRRGVCRRIRRQGKPPSDIGRHERSIRHRHASFRHGWNRRPTNGRSRRAVGRGSKPLGKRHGDLVLNGKDVAQQAVDLGTVHDVPGPDVDDAGRDPEAIAHPLVCAPHEQGRAQPVADFECTRAVDALAVNHVTRPKCTEHGRLLHQCEPDLGQVGRDRLGDALADPIICRGSTKVGERQDGNGRGRG